MLQGRRFCNASRATVALALENCAAHVETIKIFEHDLHKTLSEITKFTHWQCRIMEIVFKHRVKVTKEPMLGCVVSAIAQI